MCCCCCDSNVVALTRRPAVSIVSAGPRLWGAGCGGEGEGEGEAAMTNAWGRRRWRGWRKERLGRTSKREGITRVVHRSSTWREGAKGKTGLAREAKGTGRVEGRCSSPVLGRIKIRAWPYSWPHAAYKASASRGHTQHSRTLATRLSQTHTPSLSSGVLPRHHNGIIMVLGLLRAHPDLVQVTRAAHCLEAKRGRSAGTRVDWAQRSATRSATKW